MIGIPTANYIALDELTLNFKHASRLLTVGRSSWQVLLISGRRRIYSHTLIASKCIRHHYTLGVSALLGLEY